MEGQSSLIGLFFAWWYKDAYTRLLVYLKTFFVYIFDLFSVKICLNTLFDPWKRDQYSLENLSLKEKINIISMNAVSRLIGAIVKLTTVVTYLTATVGFAIISLFVILFWLLYPAVIIFLIFISLIRLF